MAKNYENQGWWQSRDPSAAGLKIHYYRKGSAQSLCGKWETNEWRKGTIDAETDRPDYCAGCRRRVEAMRRREAKWLTTSRKS